MINLDNFYLDNKTKKIINTWKLSYINKKNIKPLFINGTKGSGKTTIANILLNDYSIITIDINKNNIEDYIKLLLGKKDISMLFSNKKFKAIIIDDIFINKKIIKNVNLYINLLLNATNNPIIIINSYKKNKILENICNKCYYIDLILTNKQLYNITKNLFLKNKLIVNKENIYNIIKKCNSNLNSINENILYLSHNTNNYDVNNYDINHYYNNNVIKLTEKLLYNDINLDINSIYLKYKYDTNIILYNIIDNIVNITLDIDVILNLYHSILYLDYCDYYNYQYYSNIYIFFSLIYPTFQLKNKKLIKKNIEYNKYISFSLQYLSRNNDINPNLYYYFNKCLINYNLTDNKQEYLIKLKEYIIKNNLLKKNITSIIRLDTTLNNLKKKQYTYLINKLFN